jgi:hypothetical protein
VIILYEVNLNKVIKNMKNLVIIKEIINISKFNFKKQTIEIENNSIKIEIDLRLIKKL